MKIYYKLKYSETFKIESTKHLFTQDFLLKLHREKEFDGKLKNKTLTLNYFPRGMQSFIVGGAITVKANIKKNEIFLSYSLAKEQVYYIALINGGLLLSYLIGLAGLINIENPINPWFFIASAFGSYIYFIVRFQFYYLEHCKKDTKAFLSS